VATKVRRWRSCDYKHTEDAEATDTISFSFGSAAYELDVCDDHGEEPRNLLSELAGRATKVSIATRGVHGIRQAAPAPRRRAGADRLQKTEIRRWVRERHPEVSERGRIHQKYVDEWHAAHPAS
jgi:Lsr2